MKEVAGIRLPDSALCRAATEYVTALDTPVLLHHVLRSYLYAEWIGRLRGLRCDSEALYLATVLHDLGLTRLAPVQSRFEVEGADLARAFLAARGLDDRRLDIVWEAIALHTTAEIPTRRSPEVALCFWGIAADVLGLPSELRAQVPEAEVLAAYPWLELDRELPRALVGLYEKSPAAATSNAVADACQRLVPDFRRFNLCDTLHGRAASVAAVTESARR